MLQNGVLMNTIMSKLYGPRKFGAPICATSRTQRCHGYDLPQQGRASGSMFRGSESIKIILVVIMLLSIIVCTMRILAPRCSRCKRVLLCHRYWHWHLSKGSVALSTEEENIIVRFSGRFFPKFGRILSVPFTTYVEACSTAQNLARRSS